MPILKTQPRGRPKFGSFFSGAACRGREGDSALHLHVSASAASPHRQGQIGLQGQELWPWIDVGKIRILGRGSKKFLTTRSIVEVSCWRAASAWARSRPCESNIFFLWLHKCSAPLTLIGERHVRRSILYRLTTDKWQHVKIRHVTPTSTRGQSAQNQTFTLDITPSSHWRNDVKHTSCTCETHLVLSQTTSARSPWLTFPLLPQGFATAGYSKLQRSMDIAAHITWTCLDMPWECFMEENRLQIIACRTAVKMRQ